MVDQSYIPSIPGQQTNSGLFDWLANLGQPQGQAAAPVASGAASPVVQPPGMQNNLSVGLGANVGTGQLAIGGLSALGNLWTAWNATDLAKKSFNFNKQVTQTNLANQAETYNTNLADRANSRAVMENQAPGQAQAYIAAHSLKGTL